MKEELEEGGFGRGKIMERLAVVPVYGPLEQEAPEELDQEKEKEDVHDQTETHEEQHQEPHQHEETHEGRKVSSKYVILIIITLKKYVGYTILC